MSNTYHGDFSSEDKDMLNEFSDYTFWKTPDGIYARHITWKEQHRTFAASAYEMKNKLAAEKVAKTRFRFLKK